MSDTLASILFDQPWLTDWIWLIVKFCPFTDSTGGVWVRLTELTTPVTTVDTLTGCPEASCAVTDIV